MKHIENRIVWLFREPRSGSTSSAGVIARKLNRKLFWIDSLPEYYRKIPIFSQKENDHEFIFDTHFFPGLTSMKNYTDPILIRISRRDVVEQCLSFLACELMDWKFFNMTHSLSDSRNIFEEFTKTKVELKKDRVDFFARHRMKQNKYWDEVGTNYEHQVIYYEDMDKPVDIPILGLYNLNMLTETIKLPDYKKDVFTNYDQVKEWLSVYKL